MRGFGDMTSAEGRKAARGFYLPKDVREQTPQYEHENGSAVYVYDSGAAPYSVAFSGTAAKPAFHYRHRSVEEREKTIAEFIVQTEERVARMSQRRADKAAWVNPLKVGDVLYTSWGYDQTNCDFYAVTYVSGKRIKVRPICGERAEGHDRVQATRPIVYRVGEETTHTAQPAGERGVSVTIDNSRTAWLDTPGASHYETAFGMGH